MLRSYGRACPDEDEKKCSDKFSYELRPQIYSIRHSGVHAPERLRNGCFLNICQFIHLCNRAQRRVNDCCLTSWLQVSLDLSYLNVVKSKPHNSLAPRIQLVRACWMLKSPQHQSESVVKSRFLHFVNSRRAVM